MSVFLILLCTFSSCSHVAKYFLLSIKVHYPAASKARLLGHRQSRDSRTTAVCSGDEFFWHVYNADPFIFCGWSNNLEWTSSRSKVLPKRCLFSIPPPSQDCSFPLGLGRERL